MNNQNVKEYLRVDDDTDTLLIDALILAAKEYLNNAGIEESTSELYKLAINLLVSHWYENREVVGKVEKLAHSLDSIMHQLKYC